MRTENRKATSQYVSPLVELMEELGYTHTEDSISANLKKVEKKDGAVFIVVYYGKIVSCIWVILDIRLAAGVCGELTRLVVLPRFREKGFGKGLVGHAEKWLSSRVEKIFTKNV